MTELSNTRERSTRVRMKSQGRHLADVRTPRFAAGFSALGQLAYDGCQVSANIVDLVENRTLVSIDDRVVLPTASIGKVLLLIEVSARLTAQDFTGYGILDKSIRDTVGEAGLWQHLQAPSLPVADLATLVGATSDSMATNLLLRQVGLGAVRARTEQLGLSRTALLDIVREAVDPGTSQRVTGWLSLNTDMSMVASAFGLDPLAHRRPDHGTLLINKTGSDVGVRAEAGALKGKRTMVSYAVTVQFDDDSLNKRLRVLDAMRTIGQEILDYVH